MIKEYEVAELDEKEFLCNYISYNELVKLVIYMDLISDIIVYHSIGEIIRTIEDDMNDYTLDELKEVIRKWRHGE